MKLPYRQKENPYLLVIILGDPISYRDGIIYFETELVKVMIKKKDSYKFWYPTLRQKQSSFRNAIFIKVQPKNWLKHRNSGN